MLKIVKYGVDRYDFPALIVLGCFDGLHRGHMSLIKQAALEAKINGLDLGIMMFEKGKGDKQLYTLDERLDILSGTKVKFVLTIDFNDEFKKTTPGAFLDKVSDIVNVKAFMSGKDFHFGKDAKGKASTIKNYAEKDENVWYKSVKDLTEKGQKIGVTGIREMLENGDIEGANALLGRNFYITAPVISGDGRGRLLGFPTANIRWPEGKIEIKQGVYNVLCDVDGVQYKGIANFGGRPTFNEDEPLVEVHLESFSGDLYGKTVRVEFVSYIRDISRFSSADALVAQLKSDLAGGAPVEDTGASAPAEPAKKEAPALAEPVKKEVPAPAEPVAAESAAEPVAEVPVEVPVAEAVAETVAEPVVETVAEPVAEEAAEVSVEESADVPVAEAVAETVAEPVVETVAEPVAEEAAEV
ncbi:MAG: riboflavin biosynthesis protein RibF, partial [Clostridia bacterium]|nr:riboflavin biosynthesis protein RibF [Clostridia bacterium]